MYTLASVACRCQNVDKLECLGSNASLVSILHLDWDNDHKLATNIQSEITPFWVYETRLIINC